MLPISTASPGARIRHRFNECLYIEALNLTFVPVSKVGSCSLLLALWEKYPEAPRRINSDELTSPAVAMLRQPTERAWSSYLWHRRPSKGAIGPPNPEFDNFHPDPNLAFAEWLRELAMRSVDETWAPSVAPQTEFLTSDVSYTLIPWDFAALGRLLHVQFGHENKRQVSDEMPDITPEMQYHLNIIYGADYQLWDSIQ